MAKKNLTAAAAAATEGMFTQLPGQMEFKGTDMEITEPAGPVGAAEKEQKKPARTPGKGPEKKSKVTFSYRTSAESVAALKAYADASGSPTGALVDAAIAEYIKRHPLKGAAAEIYALKLKK